MNDKPQFVIDAATRTTPSPSFTTSVTPSSTSVLPTGAPQPTDQPTGGSLSIGAIVGVAVGGVALLALLALLFCCCFLRRRKKTTKNNTKIQNIRKEDIRVYANFQEEPSRTKGPKFLHA